MVEQRERDKKICFVDPLFYARLVENGILILNNVQRWRHKRDLLDCDSVYFIINDNNQHWFLIVADFTSKRWRVFDSIREAPSRAVFVGVGYISALIFSGASLTSSKLAHQTIFRVPIHLQARR